MWVSGCVFANFSFHGHCLIHSRSRLRLLIGFKTHSTCQQPGKTIDNLSKSINKIIGVLISTLYFVSKKFVKSCLKRKSMLIFFLNVFLLLLFFLISSFTFLLPPSLSPPSLPPLPPLPLRQMAALVFFTTKRVHVGSGFLSFFLFLASLVSTTKVVF